MDDIRKQRDEAAKELARLHLLKARLAIVRAAGPSRGLAHVEELIALKRECERLETHLMVMDSQLRQRSFRSRMIVKG